MGALIHFIYAILDGLLGLLVIAIIISAVLSWLVAFDVVNVRNPTVNRIVHVLNAITDPLLRPIRRFMPNLGGIDISPIILLLLLQALKILIERTIAGPLIAALG